MDAFGLTDKLGELHSDYRPQYRQAYLTLEPEMLVLLLQALIRLN